MGGDVKEVARPLFEVANDAREGQRDAIPAIPLPSTVPSVSRETRWSAVRGKQKTRSPLGSSQMLQGDPKDRGVAMRRAVRLARVQRHVLESHMPLRSQTTRRICASVMPRPWSSLQMSASMRLRKVNARRFAAPAAAARFDDAGVAPARELVARQSVAHDDQHVSGVVIAHGVSIMRALNARCKCKRRRKRRDSSAPPVECQRYVNEVD